MSIVPGLYRITTHLAPNPAIGVDPRINSAIKPVVAAPPDFSPEGTIWEVLQEDGELYLLLVNSARTRDDDDKVFAYYAEPGEKWKIVHHPEYRGYTIQSSDESLYWNLPNSEYHSQIKLNPMGIRPGEEYFFNLEKLVPNQ